MRVCLSIRCLSICDPVFGEYTSEGLPRPTTVTLTIKERWATAAAEDAAHVLDVRTDGNSALTCRCCESRPIAIELVKKEAP